MGWDGMGYIGWSEVSFDEQDEMRCEMISLAGMGQVLRSVG